MSTNVKKKVVIGLSGGVDSSVAAYLLKEQGYDVIGATMQIWTDEAEEQSETCSSIEAVQDAKAVADMLGIAYHVVNFKPVFEEKVISYFINEYKSGRTPNPCNVCNRYVKWEALLKAARELGADYIATGHYARIQQLDNGRYTLRKSAAKIKDQTYALYNLTQEQLSHTLMPLGEYEKKEVRAIAQKIGLKVADKKDSVDICFVPDKDYAGFIKRKDSYEAPEGNFIDMQGNVIGRHKGIIHYTVGQRKGLNLMLGRPVYVAAIRPDTNEVVIGGAEDVKTDRTYVYPVNYLSVEGVLAPLRVHARIRYNHSGAPATLFPKEDGRMLCVFDEPQRAITPGQSLVCYNEDYIVCGGTIL